MSSSSASNSVEHRLITLNVGGKIFQTTSSTLHPSPLLHSLSLSSSPIFLDRDSHLFPSILSLLRHHSPLPPSLAALALEAAFYGIQSLLKPAQFSGIDASQTHTISPIISPTISTFAACDDGSVSIAHSGLISTYDLRHQSTFRTHVDTVDSLRRISTDLVAFASKSIASPGLHFYGSGRHVGSVHWTDPSDPRIHKAVVTAIAANAEDVFAAVECPHKENCILQLSKSTLKLSSEIGRQSGSSTRSLSPAKMTWMGRENALFSSAVNVGAFGYSGNMRIWDPRSGRMVWETVEPGSGRNSTRFGDAFSDADVEVSDDVATKIYKVCWKSGDIAVADVRMLSDDPWIYYPQSAGGRKGGSGEESVLCCFKKQVLVSRNGGVDLEVWSRQEDGGLRRSMVEEGRRTEVVRRMEGGGERLFVSRSGGMEVEVWETSHDSNPILISAGRNSGRVG